MGKRSQKKSTDGGEALSANPFGALELGGLPRGPASAPVSPAKPIPPAKPTKNRGRLDVKREKSGRGGKTVTVVSGWKGIAAEEKAALAKQIQKSCGVGGAVKNGNVEIQGDQREAVAECLEKAGFRVVFAGG